MFWFLLGVYLGVELLDNMVTLCLTIWGTARLFYKVVAPFSIPTAMDEGSDFSTFLLTFVIIWFFLVIAILVCEKWYLIVVFSLNIFIRV